MVDFGPASPARTIFLLPNAGQCLVSKSDICQLAMSTCRGALPLAIAGRQPAIARIEPGVLCAGPVNGMTRGRMTQE